MKKCLVPILGILALLLSPPVSLARKAPSPTAATPTVPLEASAEGKALHTAWEQAQYHFTPAVRTAYLATAKAQARRDLAAAGKTLPADFLAWVDSDPVVEATIYGVSLTPAHALLVLRSLEIDLGQEAVRKKYTQLALAMAVMNSAEGPQADITPRDPLKLVIPPCPLKPVNTKDPTRPLDLNDHIINFLNDHPPIEKDVKVGTKLDGKKKIPVFEKQKVPLVAADVLASAALQKEFNAYMKEKGQSVEINCGDHVIYPDRHEGITAAEGGPAILKAYKLFRTAYEAKGLLPAERDPTPTLAETCAFLIRNNEYKFPPELNRPWPRFPLNAPWPVLTYLALNRQPLRECEDIWERYRDKGEFHTYGEYIGGIAQQFDFQSARRLAPYPFTYGTIQMMFKDGGVCGTMANIAARTYLIHGVPASTAGQPGHCALVLFRFDAKTNTYELGGAQFVTGGPDKTHPHSPWAFGQTPTQRPMIYHQTVAWAVNFGLASYLDSTMAYNLTLALSETDRKAHGEDLLESALAINPYNFLLADTGQALAAAPQAQIHLWKSFQTSLAAAAGKPGCPADSLYIQTVRDNLYAALARLPVPADQVAAREVYAFLQSEKCDSPEVLVRYQMAVEGLPALLARTQADFKAHLASARSEETCARMARAITLTANQITDKGQRTQWALERWNDIQGHEDYFGPHAKILTDSTVKVLAKLAGQTPRPETALTQSLLDQVTAALQANVAGDRAPKTCQQLANEIATTARQITDTTQGRQWLEALAKIMAGHEEYQPKSGHKAGKPQRDPCADTISQLRASPAAHSG